MARIRTLKPEFFRSPDTARCSFKARILYQAMWCWADDYGVGETNLYGLRGFAFCDSDDVTVAEIQSLCKEICGSYGVLFYSHRGRHFYQIPTWDEHQKTERRSKRRSPTADDPESIPDQRFHGNHGTSETTQGTSETTQGTSETTQGTSETTQGKSPVGTGEQGNRGTGEKDDDSPTNATHHNATTVEAIVVENAAKPARNHPSSAARTVVRQTLGYAGYPRSTIDRLATQVDRLTREGQPDTLIRQALTAWDRRPNCERPEYLPTVLSDVLKASRASPATNGHDDKVNGYLAFANQPRQPEIEP